MNNSNVKRLINYSLKIRALVTDLGSTAVDD